MFIVLKRFKDLQDNSFVYEEGDTYPRKGIVVDDERLAELMSDKNKRGEPLIKSVIEKKQKKTKKK